ncbi:hypothetical protein HETIRDRAFT_472427 [Heterobasidion irregulare TC 32-1]|uniref:Uncharacterized protein n=1 Tax=Heterobasidion irregulare (strain TC 32-1) TaxID=747525 RepID=W4KFE2_HETIT|nr:uncharacterized protein HETIRDRAFT_472427 [Heterobasidion irregulare TC 32-1]ETW84030.1 hypothetical protein HETIRDRAFT_472427 [Heterobasidion irregulare TC 32-1]
MLRWHRTASAMISLLGAFTYLAFAIQLFALWRSVKWDSESEWEGSADSWTTNGVKLVGGLSVAYFVSGAVASAVGFIGIVKVRRSRIPPYIRFYRDYAVADFAFCALTTLSVTYASFRYYSFRTDICEELSRHADLMRDLAESGLSLENCEQWFERAVVAFVAVMTIIIVIRVSPVAVHAIYLASDSRMCVFLQIHLVIAVSKYYSQVSRLHSGLPVFTSIGGYKDDSSMHRIYLLPSPTSPTASSCPPGSTPAPTAVVYAPVPLRDLSERDARELNAREAWIHAASHQPTRQHRRSHSRSHRHGSWSGRIGLASRPNEGLLPSGPEKCKD